ncbi:hypothetical protein [Micromonospora sp. NBC_01813]|uniref:hypothetical protein n=1 Tax=Micromonospora sp. NBC_01813 TaxID=2975988 RepID=UPI002DDA9D17|nr:hypothetical protein [Micromonospora sp. NBC_01813]WSA09696.1 hypothetical protein OG958_02440 [Micromonospora sp. NBC_01813]
MTEARQKPTAAARAGAISAEVVVSIGVAFGFLAWSSTIDVDPLDRRGQVSGLAALQFRFAVLAAVLVVAMLVAHRLLAPAHRHHAVRVGCAAAAGLATGLVAGGIAVALDGTRTSLWAGGGDYEWILDWTAKLWAGQEISDHYPPVVFWLIGAWASLTGQEHLFALKDLQLAGTALFGPAAYLAWRLVLRPVWAVAIGVLAMLPLIEPVKPYPQITLVMLLPVLVKFLSVLRGADRLSQRRALVSGLLAGVGFGLLFLLYSGWYVWCAGGMLLACAFLAPWRHGWRPAMLLGGAAVASFLAVGWVHLRGLLAPTGGTSDDYFYFDTDTEPTYIAMWRNDRPADVGPVWPPVGELGGVGVFTLLLAAGLGAAIVLGWRRSIVIAAGACATSAWFMRMWLASEQWETQTVRLYPRTTAVVLYCLLVLAGFGVMLAIRHWRRRLDGEPRRPTAPAGLLLIPVLFVFASAGSATADRYMPDERADHAGYFAWIAQTKPYPDGRCSRWGAAHGCVPQSERQPAD